MVSMYSICLPSGLGRSVTLSMTAGALACFITHPFPIFLRMYRLTAEGFIRNGIGGTMSPLRLSSPRCNHSNTKLTRVHTMGIEKTTPFSQTSVL